MIVEPAKSEDRQGILAVTAKIDIFTDEEKDTVRELWDDGGYNFLVAHHAGRVIGFTCFGERGLTRGTYDLYWIAVDPSARRLGAGKALMRATESDVQKRGGRLIVIETSGLEEYASTRAFYEGVGYEKEAVIRDFYKVGDDLVIYTLHL
ncbi:MAG: GNAT family N-acetyltransferase [Anaerolineaceae bacterium]|nr:MAG: GNAT family N-acetyltransferase [Anaerolineaceae bacterium]